MQRKNKELEYNFTLEKDICELYWTGPIAKWNENFDTRIQKFKKYSYRWNFDILKPVLESSFNTHSNYVMFWCIHYVS